MRSILILATLAGCFCNEVSAAAPKHPSRPQTSGPVYLSCMRSSIKGSPPVEAGGIPITHEEITLDEANGTAELANTDVGTTVSGIPATFGANQVVFSVSSQEGDRFTVSYVIDRRTLEYQWVARNGPLAPLADILPFSGQCKFAPKQKRQF
jgi:hypothetical protein